MGFASRLWARTRDYIFMKDSPDHPELSQERLLHSAQQELESAYNVFSRAEDPEMIEFAVYNLKAAEKRYDYLLKQARKR